MAAKPSLKRLLEFQELLLKLRAVERTIYLPPDNEQENDVEHSYNLAMTAWFLSPHFAHLDTDKLVRLALAHDLLEVHSGDTFVYGDEAALASKHQREQQAVKLLAKDWPDFTDLHDAIKEYEARQSDEAKFVYALDKLMPTFLNVMSKGYFWLKHSITYERFREEKAAKVAISPEINNYYEQLLKLLQEHPEYFARPGRNR